MLSLIFSKPDRPKALGCSSQNTASRPCTSSVSLLRVQGLNIFPQQIPIVVCPLYLMRREKNAKAEIILLAGRIYAAAQGLHPSLAPQHLWLCYCQPQVSRDDTELHFPHFKMLPLLLLLTKEAQVCLLSVYSHTTSRVHEYTVYPCLLDSWT